MEALHRLIRRRQVAVRLLAAVGLALLCAVDVYLSVGGASSGGSLSWRGSVTSAVLVVAADAIAVTALLVPMSLPTRVGWAAVASLAVTLMAPVVGGAAPGLAAAAAIAGLLVLAARRCRPRVSAALAAVLVVAPARLGANDVTVTLVLLWALIAATAVGAGVVLRSIDNDHRRAEVAVRDTERRALARDLHDFVAHHVTGVVVQAQAARIVARRDPDGLDLLLSDIERAGSEAMAAMRRLVTVLREATDLRPVQADLDDLDELVRAHRDGGLPAVHFDVEETLRGRALPPEVTTTVHRIVLEALTNVRRHAPDAASVDIEIASRGGHVEVRVRDDGPGHVPAPADAGGFGLLGLQERVTVLGGEFHAGRPPTGGWEIAARLPAPQVARP